jgi:hypothetical protein
MSFLRIRIDARSDPGQCADARNKFVRAPDWAGVEDIGGSYRLSAVSRQPSVVSDQLSANKSPKGETKGQEPETSNRPAFL